MDLSLDANEAMDEFEGPVSPDVPTILYELAMVSRDSKRDSCFSFFF